MALPRRIQTVRFDFIPASGSPTTVVPITVQHAEYKVVHENPLDNPMFVKSLTGYLIPYSVQARLKFSFTFDRMTAANTDEMRTIFNGFTLTHQDGGTIELYYRWYDGSASSTEKSVVVLDTPLEMIETYKAQHGTFRPTISLISQELLTSVPSSFEGI